MAAVMVMDERAVMGGDKEVLCNTGRKLSDGSRLYTSSGNAIGQAYHPSPAAQSERCNRNAEITPEIPSDLVIHIGDDGCVAFLTPWSAECTLRMDAILESLSVSSGGGAHRQLRLRGAAEPWAFSHQQMKQLHHSPCPTVDLPTTRGMALPISVLVRSAMVSCA
jgi:hypothetical protein